MTERNRRAGTRPAPTTAGLPDDERKRLIRLIHVAKGPKGLRLSDDAYRDVLEGATGLRSCSAMNDGQLIQAYRAFQDLGFVPTGGKATGGKARSPASKHKRVKTQADKVRALWIELGKAGITSGREDALQSWLDRMFARKGVAWANQDRLKCLSREQLRTAIESLKKMLERE